MSPAEAIHLGSLVAANGYIFPISDHVLTLKDDGTLYRFQVGAVWNKMMGEISAVKLTTTIPAKLISIKVNALCPHWTVPQRAGRSPRPPHFFRAGTLTGPRGRGQRVDLFLPGRALVQPTARPRSCSSHFNRPLNAFIFTSAAPYLQPLWCLCREGNMCHTRSFSSS